MKKEELKKVLKPLIKECIKEVIFEDGTLSGIITEVAKGLGSTQLQTAPSKPINEAQSGAVKAAKMQLEETKRSLEKSAGFKGIFENTQPLRSGGSQSAQYGALRDSDPNDPGIDISQFSIFNK
jgi:hypothetical protein